MAKKQRKVKIPLDSIHLGDTGEYLKTLPDESVDLVVSSPPYNIGKEYESKKCLDIYLDEQTEILKECARVMKPTGSIFWQVGSFADKGALIPLDIRFFPILESLGMIPINRIIWVRQHGLHGKNKFSGRHETLLWFAKSKSYKFSLEEIRVPQKYQNKKSYRGDTKGKLSCNPDGKNPGDIWVFRNVKHNHEEQTIHPCQFPEDMVARVVLSTTEKGDVVLDPYMGTGTAAVVARDYDRHYLGAELDESYHAVSVRRLEGKPDANGSFANLKCLRDHVEKTGDRIEKYRFDVQVSKKATERSKSKIYPESHHLTELQDRLSFEEDCFSSNLKGEEPPEDPLAHNRKVKKKIDQTLPLFENISD